MSQPARNPAEFDELAANYDAGMDDPIKRLAGKDSGVFVRQKIFWLRQILKHFPRRDANDGVGLSLLDFGCGTGDFLHALRDSGFSGELSGSDVSAEMIAQARVRWPDLAKVRLMRSEDRVPMPDQSVDVITVSCVFHHVEVENRRAVMADLFRLLRPGGFLVIFEHNPFNPLTRWIVAKCPIDRNAILLPGGETTELLSRAGFENPRVRYFLFVPPRLSALWPLERAITWLPLGGQYFAWAAKGG